jgi:hypothetical protein
MIKELLIDYHPSTSITYVLSITDCLALSSSHSSDSSEQKMIKMNRGKAGKPGKAGGIKPGHLSQN